MTPGEKWHRLVVSGRQGVRVTVEIAVYQGNVWVVSLQQPCVCEAIFEPAQVDRMVELLAQAGREARGRTKDKDSTDTGSAP